MVSWLARGPRTGWLTTSCAAAAVCLSLTTLAAARPIVVSPPGEDVAFPDVQMASTGEFVLGWQSPDELIDVVQGSAPEPLNAPVPVKHFGDRSSDLSALAINSARLRVVVWLEPTRHDRPNVNLAVWVAVRTRGGRWQSHRVGGRVALADPVAAYAAPGPRQGAVLIWEQPVGKNRTAVIDAFVGSDGHVGSSRIGYVQSGASSSDPPKVTFAADGTATVAWDGEGSVLVGRLSASGKIRSIQRIGNGCTLGDMAENAAGAAAMTLDCPTKPARVGSALRVAERRPGRRFHMMRPLRLAMSSDAVLSAVEVSPLGQVTAMWSQTPPGLNESSTARSVVASGVGGQPLGAPRALTSYSTFISGPQVLSGLGGAPYVCWNAKAGVFVAAVHFDGSLGPRLKLAGSDADNPSLAIDGNGDGLASWRSNGRVQQGAGNGYRVYVIPFKAPPA